MVKLFLVTWLITILGPVPPEELTLINTRRNYYPNAIGSIFENKVFYYWNRVEGKVFRLLDPNFYLFNSHPRENG